MKSESASWSLCDHWSLLLITTLLYSDWPIASSVMAHARSIDCQFERVSCAIRLVMFFGTYSLGKAMLLRYGDREQPPIPTLNPFGKLRSPLKPTTRKTPRPSHHCMSILSSAFILNLIAFSLQDQLVLFTFLFVALFFDARLSQERCLT